MHYLITTEIVTHPLIKLKFWYLEIIDYHL